MRVSQKLWKGRFLITKGTVTNKYIGMVGNKSIIYFPINIAQNSIYKVQLDMYKENGNGFLYCNIYGNKNFDFPHVRIICDSSSWNLYTFYIEAEDFPNTIPLSFRLWRMPDGNGTVFIREIKIELLENAENQINTPLILIQDLEKLEAARKLEEIKKLEAKKIEAKKLEEVKPTEEVKKPEETKKIEKREDSKNVVKKGWRHLEIEKYLELLKEKEVTYKKDEELEKIFNNKRVVFIGPSKHLEDKNNGSKFDEFDVVCRVNKLFPFGCENDYGNRTDVLFSNLNTEAIVDLTKDLTKYSNLKYVVCPQRNLDGNKNSIVENFDKCNKDYKIPFHKVSDEYYYSLYKEVGQDPYKGSITSGIASLIVLLNYNIKELLITGISFYAQVKPGVKGSVYNDCYHKNYLRDSFKYLSSIHIHPQEEVKIYFKNVIMKKYGNIIIVDNYLNDLLNLNHYRVFNLG